MAAPISRRAAFRLLTCAAVPAASVVGSSSTVRAAAAFPGDPELINAALRINLLFREAGRQPSEDWCSPIWMGRYLWDRFAGLDHETSIRKHEAELREALALNSQPLEGREAGRIRTDGPLFRDESGALWRWKGCTDFLLFKRFLDGEDIASILDERIGLGINVMRVLGM